MNTGIAIVYRIHLGCYNSCVLISLCLFVPFPEGIQIIMFYL